MTDETKQQPSPNEPSSITIADDQGVITMEIRSKAKLKWLSWIPIIINSALCLVMLGVIGSAFIIPAMRLFAPFALIFLIISYKSLFSSGWANYGYELIKIEGNVLHYKRIWWLFRRNRKFEKEKMKHLELIDDSKSGVYISDNSPEGFMDIQIRFKYGRRKQMIGKHLTSAEAEELYAIMQHFAQMD